MRSALAAIVTLTKLVDLQNKLLDSIRERAAPLDVEAFLLTPDWLATQAVLVEAVRPFPDALDAIAAALEAVGKP